MQGSFCISYFIKLAVSLPSPHFLTESSVFWLTEILLLNAWQSHSISKLWKSGDPGLSDSPTSARVSAPPSGAFLCLVTGKAVVIVFSVDDKMQCYYLKKKNPNCISELVCDTEGKDVREFAFHIIAGREHNWESKPSRPCYYSLFKSTVVSLFFLWALSSQAFACTIPPKPLLSRSLVPPHSQIHWPILSCHLSSASLDTIFILTFHGSPACLSKIR